MKVLTIGGAMVDTIAIIDSSLIEKMSMSNADRSFLLLEQGKKTEALCISTHCGGGAVNTAVAFKRLGFDTSILIKVGSDDRAETILAALDKEGIRKSWVTQTQCAPTGASTVVSSHDRNAAIFTFRGANTLLTRDDLRDEMFDVDVVYVSPLSGKSCEILSDIVARASGRVSCLAVNPGIRQISTRFPILCRALPFIDILALNRSEAAALLAHGVAELSGSENRLLRTLLAGRLSPSDDQNGSDPHATARAMLSGIGDLGARTVLLTDGRRGAYALRDDTILFCNALDVDVVGTAGAGDAFVSTFTAFTASGHSIENSLCAAAVNGAAVVRHAEAQTGLLTSTELSDYLTAHSNAFQIESWKREV